MIWYTLVTFPYENLDKYSVAGSNLTSWIPQIQMEKIYYASEFKDTKSKIIIITCFCS